MFKLLAEKLVTKTGMSLGLALVVACSITSYLILRAYLVPRRMDLSKKVIVITGGSAGIGKAVAKEALKRGASVILVARNLSLLETAQKELTSSALREGQQVLVVSQDVGVGLEAVEKALRPAIDKLGGYVDVLINCAGTSIAASFDTLSPTAFEDMMRINYLGSVYPTRVVLPGMKARKQGAVVFVSSQAGQVGLWGYSAYSASKFALRGLAQALQMEAHAYGVFISVAYPPDTDTPGFEKENLTKPKETALISGGGSVFSAEQVAKDILNGVERRRFTIYTGVDGFMLAQLSAGMEPAFSVVEAGLQVLTASLFRLVSLFYLVSFYRIVAQCARQPPKSKPE